MNSCKHEFQPRYDEKWTTAFKEVIKSNSGIGVKYEGNGKGITEPYLNERTYIYDICVKCGEIKKLKGD